MVYRIAEDHLGKWLKRKRRKPLILRGARQVGKSTLVRQFASKTGIHLNEINLERHLFLNDIFRTLEIEHIIKELDAIIGANIQKPGSLLFLDEIQATPYALQHVSFTTRTRAGNEPVVFELLSLPLYLVEELPNIVDQLRLGGVI